MQEYSAFFLFVEWIVRLLFIPVIAMKYRPPAALAWIAIVSFQPFVGIVLLYIFGSNRLPRRRIAEHARRRRTLQLDIWPLLHKYCIDPEPLTERQSRHCLSVQLGEMPAVTGNDFELIDDTDEVINRIIEDIEQAEVNVHLLFYIWRNDETGKRMADAIVAAEQRGVHCRVLVDAVGSGSFIRAQSQRLEDAGVEIWPILPVNLFRRRFHRIDMRNHRKLVVIDGKVAYTGSQNIVNSDYGTKRIIWHDLMMRLKGPIVLQLQSVFLTDWFAETHIQLDKHECFPHPRDEGDHSMQLFPSGPTYRTLNLHRLIVAMLYQARREVTITTPYFVPDDSLMQAIEVARLRGVRVILVLPERSDQILVSAAQRSFYAELLEMDVEIFLFKPGLLHSKTLTIDRQFALVGTSNMDIRSFSLNLELNLILFDEATVETVSEQQKAYLKRAVPLTHSEWEDRHLLKSFGEAVARLLAPLL